MKKYIKSSTNIESQLQGLVSDMLYEEYDNTIGGKYAEVSFEDILDSVIDHVKWVIFEADDDEVYIDVANAFESNPSKYTDLIRTYVNNEIDDYPWTVIW